MSIMYKSLYIDMKQINHSMHLLVPSYVAWMQKNGGQLTVGQQPLASYMYTQGFGNGPLAEL